MIKPKILIFCDLDGVLCDIYTHARKKLQEFPQIKYPQSQYGFFMELPEIDKGVQTVKELQNDYDEHFDIWFLTAPSTHNPMSYAEKNYWIRMHFGQKWCDKLIICPDKSLLRGHILIDDNVSGRGQDKFIGELIHFTKDNNWKVIKNYLIGKLL